MEAWLCGCLHPEPCADANPGLLWRQGFNLALLIGPESSPVATSFLLSLRDIGQGDKAVAQLSRSGAPCTLPHSAKALRAAYKRAGSLRDACRHRIAGATSQALVRGSTKADHRQDIVLPGSKSAPVLIRQGGPPYRFVLMRSARIARQRSSPTRDETGQAWLGGA